MGTKHARKTATNHTEGFESLGPLKTLGELKPKILTHENLNSGFLTAITQDITLFLFSNFNWYVTTFFFLIQKSMTLFT